ncbi:MAG: nucleotidyltransferase [Lachnospiraceae bacterium]|nr:nucleotidyltransferase [Lachnospiraceae bacterium]
MKVCGIIAEYNPFHNGHLHQLQEAIRLSHADYTIVVMSGNFMQRGTPALMDKYYRAKAALSCGADLVLELPSYYAAGSAEYFALGGVSLLDKLGIVTHLCFGSECGDITFLSKIADITADESPDYQACLQSHLRSGKTYPSARTAAILEVCPNLSASISELSSPNNILGIEYLKNIKRLNSTISPITLKRCGSDYHDIRLGINQSSATAIRQAILSEIPLTELTEQMPEASFDILSGYLSENKPVFLRDFSEILYYKLLTERDKGFTEYLDVSQALSDRIVKHLYEFDGFEAFCNLLKTKEVTYSRISRCLLHILLDMRKSELEHYISELEITSYARILGFRKSSSALLTAISKTSAIPLITKLADAQNILSDDAFNMLRKEILINDIYSSIRASKSKAPMINEYTTPIVIV